MSSYDDTFDKSQFALYDYDATNDNVKDLFNKYRMFKRNVDEQNKKLGYSGYQFTEKIDNPSYISNITAKQAGQLIHLQDFIQYCDAIINSNIKELNYYEKLIFDEVLINGKRLIDVENNPNCDRSYVYLSKKKKSCILNVSKWFDIYVLNINFARELENYEGYEM